MLSALLHSGKWQNALTHIPSRRLILLRQLERWPRSTAHSMEIPTKIFPLEFFQMLPNTLWFACCLLLSGVAVGFCIEIGRPSVGEAWRSIPRRRVLPGKSKSLVFSVPNSPETEQKLEAEISDLSQRKAAVPVATEREKAEIDRLRQQVENSIINLEALKRVYAEQPSGRSSDARPMSYIPGSVAPALLGYK